MRRLAAALAASLLLLGITTTPAHAATHHRTHPVSRDTQWGG